MTDLPAIDTLRELQKLAPDLYSAEQLAGSDNRNDRSGSSTAKIPVQAGRIDFARYFEGGLLRLLHDIRAEYGIVDPDMPLALLQPGYRIRCPGSCERPDSLWYVSDTTEPYPIYCRDERCRDDDGTRVKRPLLWLKARVLDPQDPNAAQEMSVLDRYKALYAESEDRRERLWQALESAEQMLADLGHESPQFLTNPSPSVFTLPVPFSRAQTTTSEAVAQ